MIKNGLRVGDSDLFVTSGGTTVKNLTVGNVSIPSTIGSDDQILKVVSGSLAFASVAEIEDSDLSKVANLQNKVDGLINRLDSDDDARQIGTLVVDSDGQILLNTNDDVANSGTLTIDSDGQILFLTGNDTLDSVGNAILSLRADRDSDSSKLGKISEVINRLDSDSTAIQSLATKTRADLDSDSIIIQSLKAATNTNTANIAGLGGIDSDHTFQTLTVNNTTTDDSILVTTTEDSNSAGPVITLKRNSSSVADADYLGQIKFKGENDADQEIVYAKITGKIQDASDGTEDGIIEIAHKKAGSNNISARFNSNTLQLINGTGLEVAGTSTLSGLTVNGDIDAEGISSIAGHSMVPEFIGNLYLAGNTTDAAELQNCFSSTYSVYRLIGTVGGSYSAEANVKFRFLTGTDTQESTGWYGAGRSVDDSQTLVNSASANGDSVTIVQNQSSTGFSIVDMHVYMQAGATQIIGMAGYHDQSSDRGIYHFGFKNDQGTAKTGFRLFNNQSNNMSTINWSVYGIRIRQNATSKMTGSYS